jgi:hypothetical protein
MCTLDLFPQIIVEVIRRHTESLFAPGDTISENLKRLATDRTDIFGSAAEQGARAAAVSEPGATTISDGKLDDEMLVLVDAGDGSSVRATKRVRTEL